MVWEQGITKIGHQIRILQEIENVVMYQQEDDQPDKIGDAIQIAPPDPTQQELELKLKDSKSSCRVCDSRDSRGHKHERNRSNRSIRGIRRKRLSEIAMNGFGTDRIKQIVDDDRLSDSEQLYLQDDEGLKAFR